MHEIHQAFFEQCCTKRLFWRQVVANYPEEQPQADLLTQMLTLLDQTCLNQAEGRIISGDDIRSAQQRQIDSTIISELPMTPLWLLLDEPLSLPNNLLNTGKTAEQQEKTFFFRSPWSEAMMSQASIPPFIKQMTLADARAQLPSEWHLDLIQTNGETSQSYYYDQRTGEWNIMEDHQCPACSKRMDKARGYQVIEACQACQYTMNVLIQLFCTLLTFRYGQPISLQRVAWQQLLQIFLEKQWEKATLI
jgi:hypothetical protein